MNKPCLKEEYHTEIVPTNIGSYDYGELSNKDDLAALLSIEKESFEFPWTEYDFTLMGKQQHIYCRKIQIWIDGQPKIIGFFIYQLNQFSIEILNLAISADYRRLGLGSQALSYVMEKMGGGRRVRLDCWVLESNVVAQLWLRANGFRCRKIEHPHFDDITEDSYLFSITQKAVDNTLLSVGE